MIFQMRPSVFETNSSSTHTLNISTLDDFLKFNRGEAYIIDTYSTDFQELLPERQSQIYTEEEVQDALDKYAPIYEQKYKNEKWYHPIDTNMLRDAYHDGTVTDDPYDVNKERMYARDDLGIMSYDDLHSTYDLEYYEQQFTSPSGDEMVAFGLFGYDG